MKCCSTSSRSPPWTRDQATACRGPEDHHQRELGITIPDSMNIEVHESDMQTVHLALPPDPNITEEQLEAISAGLCCCW